MRDMSICVYYIIIKVDRRRQNLSLFLKNNDLKRLCASHFLTIEIVFGSIL